MTGFHKPTDDELLLTNDGHYHGPDRHRRPSPELSYETLAQIDPALVVDTAVRRTGIHRSHFEQAMSSKLTPEEFNRYVQGTDR